jgi:hypothetical protein
VYYVGNSGEILSGCFIFPLLLCGTLSSFLRGFGSKDALRSLQQHGETKKRNSAKLRRMEHPGEPEQCTEVKSKVPIETAAVVRVELS